MVLYRRENVKFEDRLTKHALTRVVGIMGGENSHSPFLHR